MAQKPTKYREVATALNSLSTKAKALISVASNSELKVPNAVMASYGCKHCNTHFAAANVSEPFCVTCGSMDVAKTAQPVIAAPLKESMELSGIVCASCNSYNIVHDVVKASFGGKMHCVLCGEGLTDFEFKPVDDESVEEYTEEVTSEMGDPLSVEIAPPGNFTGHPSEPSHIMPVQPSPELIRDEEFKIVPPGGQTGQEAVMSTKEVEIPRHIAPPGNKTGFATEPTKSDTPFATKDHGIVPPGGFTGVIAMGPPGDGDMHPPQSNLDQGTMTKPLSIPENEPSDFDYDLMDNVDGNDFEIHVNDETAVASFGGVPVARLERNQAGELAGVWGKPSLVKAIARAVDLHGKQALASFGFQSIKLRLPIANMIRAGVEAGISRQRQFVVAQTEALEADYRQSLYIAMAGLNKGFFVNKENALKAGLYAELEAAGVRSPAKLIDRVFKQHAGSFLAASLEIAEDLMDKDVEVRNQICDAVDAASYMEAEEAEHEDADDMMAPQHHMAEMSGIRTHYSNQEQATASIRGMKLFGNY